MTNMDQETIKEVKIKKRDRAWMIGLGLFIFLGMFCVIIFTSQFSGRGESAASAASGLILAGACILIGALVGFLFGIPRRLQEDGGQPVADTVEGKTNYRGVGSSRLGYRVNTNLEQISDWLTKILVGVGLTQLGEIPEGLQSISVYFGQAFGGTGVGENFASAVVVYFLTGGFLFGYLWTRLFLLGALVRADLDAAVERVEKKIEDQAKQAEVDATALSLTTKYLNPSVEESETDVDELKKSIVGSSPSIKVQIFYMAAKLRKQTWNANKELMERTIPVFESLVQSDVENRFHRNHGQLGFALKDKTDPEWDRAEKELTEAIRIRGHWKAQGRSIYEFCRAICRVNQDKDFLENKPISDERKRKTIVEDIKVAMKDHRKGIVEKSTDLQKWIKLNNVSIGNKE